MSQIYNKKQRGNDLFSLVHDTDSGGSEPAHLDLLLSFSLDGSHGKESACNAGGPVRSLGREDPLEKGMATHSSTLAWRIPGTEQPVGSVHGVTKEVDTTEQ